MPECRVRALTAFASLAVALAACQDDGVRPTAVVQASDTADQVIDGFDHYVTRAGIRRSHVIADTAWFFEATQTTLLANPRMTFYDEQGVEASTLVAKRGNYKWASGAMDATGDVVMRATDGRTLRSQFLRYDAEAKQISTDRPFTFDDKEKHIEGNYFRSDTEFRNITAGQPRGTSDEGMLLPGEE